MIHFKGRQLYKKLFCLPSEKGPAIKGKKGSKFFAFIEDPFSEGSFVCREANRKSQKLSPWNKILENLPGVLRSLN